MSKCIGANKEQRQSSSYYFNKLANYYVLESMVLINKKEYLHYFARVRLTVQLTEYLKKVKFLFF